MRASVNAHTSSLSDSVNERLQWCIEITVFVIFFHYSSSTTATLTLYFLVPVLTEDTIPLRDEFTADVSEKGKSQSNGPRTETLPATANPARQTTATTKATGLVHLQ